MSHRFGARWVLRDVSLSVRPGETVALVGANGAGKTTLLSILAGTRAPVEGSVRRAVRPGFVPQQAAVWSRLTARENLVLAARLDGVTDPFRAAEEILSKAGLDEVADRRVAELSVGQAQRVNVAAGLLGDPRLVLLDEPTAALDPRQRHLLWGLLGQVTAQGGAVVFTTQNVEEVASHANRLVALDAGGLVFSGTVEEFRQAAGSTSSEPFEQVFLLFLERATAPA